MTFWKWSGQGHVPSDLYCFHHHLSWKYILELKYFSHVYNNTICIKMVKTVISIFVGAISKKLFEILILLLKSKLFVTSLLAFVTPQICIYIANGKYCKSLTNRSWFMEIPNFGIFRGRDLYNTFGEAVRPTIFVVYIPICCKYTWESKTVCFAVVISLLVVSNQSIIENEHFL